MLNQTWITVHSTSQLNITWWSHPNLVRKEAGLRAQHVPYNKVKTKSRGNYLFPAAETTDHAVGILHFMVLLAVMTNIARVALATARESQPTVAFLVVLACAKVGQWLSFLYGRILGDAFTSWHNHLHNTLQTCTVGNHFLCHCVTKLNSSLRV